MLRTQLSLAYVKAFGVGRIAIGGDNVPTLRNVENVVACFYRNNDARRAAMCAVCVAFEPDRRRDFLNCHSSPM